MNNFLKGDMVVMHSCQEASFPKYKNKLIKCTSDSFKSKDTEEVVFLEGVSGYFSTRFLQKVEDQKTSATLNEIGANISAAKMIYSSLIDNENLTLDQRNDLKQADETINRSCDMIRSIAFK